MPPTILHVIVQRLTSDKVKDLVIVPQLRLNITKPLGISKCAFYRKYNELPSDKRSVAPAPLLSSLRKVGAVTNHAPRCEVVTMTTAAKLLRLCQVPRSVVDSVMAKVDAATYLSTTSDDTGESSDTSESSDTNDSSGGGDSADDHESSEGANDSEGEGDVIESPGDSEGDSEVVVTNPPPPQQAEAGRYGLTSIKNIKERGACMNNIQLHMSHLKSWSQALYQPGRPADLRQQSSKTWESQQKRVYEYLGYLYHHKSVPRPNLTNYLDTHDFMSFLDFLRSRGVDKAGHTKALHAAVRVVSYLKTQPTSDSASVKEALKLLKDMGSQLGQNMVPKPKSREPEQLKEDGKWMDAPQLMARVEAVRQAAVTNVTSMKAGVTSRLDAAKSVHNALLVTMCFGYMPPLRHNSVLLTLTAPPHLGCVHPDCQHKASGCLGNRVFRHHTYGSWWLDIPHHKNTKAWKGAAIKFELPGEVAELMQHHLTWGLRALTGMLEEVAPTIFVNTNTGMPLKDQEVSQYWQKTVLEGSGVKFGPQLCRSIFVSGARDLGLAPDSAAGMAMIMGNSQSVWDSVYDRHFNSRDATAAMAAMPALRKQMLHSAAGLPAAAD